ncbi:hypothetical protein Pan216_23410 [Planctomycetes bacterium Pan216]|uniref:Uncharacterized protein n=1 Tax=Kolteria novifilia TaxID=2527975 RepID=A0A518B3B6_9BACT|nr:hypothetical protein Pan216_23410 [Planctomycetes bacterium Pan216]
MRHLSKSLLVTCLALAFTAPAQAQFKIFGGNRNSNRNSGSSGNRNSGSSGQRQGGGVGNIFQRIQENKNRRLQGRLDEKRDDLSDRFGNTNKAERKLKQFINRNGELKQWINNGRADQAISDAKKKLFGGRDSGWGHGGPQRVSPVYEHDYQSRRSNYYGARHVAEPNLEPAKEPEATEEEPEEEKELAQPEAIPSNEFALYVPPANQQLLDDLSAAFDKRLLAQLKLIEDELHPGLIMEQDRDSLVNALNLRGATREDIFDVEDAIEYSDDPRDLNNALRRAEIPDRRVYTKRFELKVALDELRDKSLSGDFRGVRRATQQLRVVMKDAGRVTGAPRPRHLTAYLDEVEEFTRYKDVVDLHPANGVWHPELDSQATVIHVPGIAPGDILYIGTDVVAVGPKAGDTDISIDRRKVIELVSSTAVAMKDLGEEPPLGIVLVRNPAENKGTIKYTIGGEEYTLPPSYIQELGSEPVKVTFEKTEGGETLTYELEPETYYDFVQGEEGWDLYTREFEVVIDNSNNSEDFYFMLADGPQRIRKGRMAILKNSEPIRIDFASGGEVQPAPHYLTHSHYKIGVDDKGEKVALVEVQ